MNRVYKVIFNRSLGLYQVVSEIARNHGRSSSHAERGRKSLLVPFVLSALLGLGLTGSALAEDTGTTVANAAVTVKDGDQMVGTGAASVSSSSTKDETSGKTTTTITVAVPNDGKVENGNTGLVTGGTVYTAVNAETAARTEADTALSNQIGTLDTQVKANVGAISKEKTDREAAVTDVSNTINSLSDSVVKYDAGSNKTKVTLAGENGTTITNVQDGAVSDSSTDAVTGKQLYAEQTARETKDTELSTKITSNATDITGIKTDITGLKDLSNVSEAGKTVIKKQAKQAVKVAADGNATVTTAGSEDDGNTLTYTIHISQNGTVSLNNTGLISGGTLYSELRPEDGTYVKRDNTTAANLSALDNNLANVINAMGLDINDTKTSYTSKLNKYFKVNPEVTTSVDGKTKTYAPDAAANGTNSLAIGPSAQAGDKSTDATTSTTTITGGKSSTAIGDSAKANGDQSVALGYGSEVLNVSGSTTAVSGSTAIGSSAKVEGGSDSTALGSGATVDTASGAMALGKGATINKTAASGVAIGNGAVTGSADQTITVNNLSYNVNAAGGVDSVAIGTDASNAGNTSIALGKGATVENDSDGNYQAVVKSDDIAIGTDAKTSASDFSTAIGKGSSVTQSTDALAVGSGAKVTTSKNAMAFGKGADAESAADSIAMGTKAKTISADTIAIGQNTSATGANSVVIGKSAQTTSEGGNAIGSSSTASGRSTAIGQSATANNFDALAIGNGATANVDRSISLGYNAGVGTSEGKGEPQNAGSLIAIGTSAGNNVSGMQNVAIGESAGSNVKSSNNIAIGTQAGYGINYASDNKVQNGYNVSIGYKANYQENAANIMYATALGNEANASNYAVAIGDGAKASGTNSLALGYSAQASDAESMALGHNASAADGNVAIGNGSLAPSVSTLGTVKAVTVDGKTINYVYDANNNQFKSAFTSKPLQADSHYISVGNSTLTRRLSNVADGVFDSDAATVGQLNSLNELLQATDTKVGLTRAYFDDKFTALNTTVDASKTHYFSISESSDNLSANKDNTGATSNKADAMAIGPNANATNVKSLAVGNNVYATGLRSIAIGTAPNPTKDVAGTTTTHNTSAEGENSIALGTSTTAQADNSIAIGTRAQTYTTDTTSKTGAGSVAIGNLATTAGNQSVALGYDATVKYDYGTAIGSEALASGTDAVAVGKGSKAYSTDSTAIGQNNTVTGSNVYGLGSSNAVSGNWGSIVQSGVSGYKNAVTSVSDQDTTNALTGVYMTGSSNTLNQDVKYNVMQDITVQGSSNTIDGGAGGTSGHPNTLSQIAILGSGNTVQGKSSDDSKTNNIKDVTILGYNNKVDANTDTTVDFSNTQILGSNVTAKLGNSVYLGSNAAYTGQTLAASDAITSARTAADAAAEASDAYKAATTDAEKAQIKAQYEAQYLYQLNVQAMEAKGTTAGTQSYSTDETYGDGTSYTYAGSSPAGVVTVGSVGAERRIQNVAAGLVSASSTDAVNGSQLYALTRQIRFGGDNSSFGTTTADDKNVVARGSNETIAITGGSDAVTPSTADGTTTYTVDTAKLTDNNIAVVADTDKNALHVQLASSLKNLNTAQLGSGSGDSYKETIKLDGTGTSGGQMTLAGADGTVKTTIDTTGLTVANGPKFTSSGIDAASQKITSVKAGEADTDAANVGQVKAAAAEATTEVKAGTNASLGTVETSAADKHKIYTVNVDNLAVKANGTGTTVALARGINFKNGTNTTSAVDNNGNVTIDTKNLTLEANGTNKASVSMDGGINFKNGTNTTATVDTDGTVTISATHNKLDSASYTASNPSDSSNKTTLKMKDTDGNETTLNLTDTYTTVSKNTNHTITFKRNDGSDSVSVSLDDLNGASKEALTTAVAKATTTVIKGNNVDSVDDDTTSADGHHIYKVNVSNLGVKVADGQKKSVALSEGLVFGNGTNTTASVGDNGAITFNVSDAAIKTKAKDAIDVVKGNDNVTVNTTTSTDGTKKTFTISAKDTYTTVTKDADKKTVTFARNDGETQTVSLSDLGGITAAQDKYVTGGTVSYDNNGNGTASLTGNNGLTASITGLKDTKVSSGAATYVGTQGDASGSATLTMNDGSKATISGLKDDYITSAAVDTEKNNHVTLTRLGGGTVDLDLNPILGKYSLSDYHLVGDGTTHDQAYAVDSNGTVTLNVVDDKNPNGAAKTIQITGLASQSGVNAGRTTVKSSDSSVTVSDSTANSDTHTYDIKVDYSKIPANLKVQYSGDNGTSGSNAMDKATAFSGTAGQIVTTAENGKVSFKLANDISGIQSVTTGDAKLATTGLTITDGPSVLKSGINAGGKTISNVGDAVNETDAATLKQVKNARTKVAAGDNVKKVTSSEATDGSHQMTYTVNVDNLSVKSNDGTAKEVALKTGLNFKNGTNTTATVGDNGEVKYDLNSTLTGLTSVTAGNSTLDNSGLTIKEGTTTKVTITGNNINMGGNVIHNVGDGVAPTDAVNKGQLDALQSQVSGGWNLFGTNSEGTAVTAQIGAGKTVTYSNGSYTKSVVTKDDTTGNATVKVDVTTGTFGLDAGKAASVTNGLATTQDVANAINSASISVVADDTPENKTAVKAGDTIHFAKDGNLTLVQNGTIFTYGLNPEISISKVTTSDATKGSTVQTAEGVTTTDAAGNTYIQNGQGITLTPSDKTKSPVKLTNTGLDNGGNKITGVGKGTDDTDAVNVAQLKEVNDKVGSGWQLADNDGTKVADIGAGKKVSFKTDSQYLTAKTESAGTDAANVIYGLKTKALEGADGKVSSVDTAEDGLATAKNVADTINQTYWTAASGKSGSGSRTDETANDADKQISAGDTVIFNAGNNLSLAQNGASFTYGLQADLTGMNTITFTPRNDAEGHPISLVIGKQKDGVGTDEGYYITGLDNTTWNQSNYVKDRAATEAQLADAIKQVTLASQSGGFKLSDDNDKEVSQVLGKAIGVVGDGNITTTAETTTADPNGHIKVSLKKNIDLGTDGSLQAGGVTLKNNSVTVGNNGIVISSTDSEKTVSNLSNTTWDTAKVNQEASAGGYKGSTKAATESQLAEAISTATSTASANEQHIKDGSYSVTTIDNGDGTKSQGVSIDIITGDGSKPEAVKGHVVIKDVAKASDLGNVSDLHDTLKNADGKKNVTGALNNLDDRVTGLDNRMNNIYTTAGQHSSVSAEDNIKIDASSTNKSGGTDYKLSLNKDEIHLGNVTFKGNDGAMEAKSMKADTFTAGITVVSNDGVKIGDKSALTSDTLKVNGKTYVSGDGLNANSRKITNVAAGSADTDAVNVKQVNDLAARQGEAITENAAHIGELGRAVNKLDNRINRVGAGAAALAALHPGSYDPDDKLDVSAGVGNYRGANAAAVGLFFHPNERTILSVAGSMGGGENMVNAGVTLKVGPGHGTPTTVTTRTGQKVDVMDILAKQTEILEKLAGNTKAASAPAGSDIFPDVPQNHWAYAYVDKLYRAGGLAGFSEPGKLKSHMLTRKDFAEILYWAMTNGATTNPELNSDGSLNRLAAEFGAELKLVMK